jgi:CheY-like chemotaxis protein
MGAMVMEIEAAARRAAGLTRQLLLFSRREPAQRRVIDLNAVVANLVTMLSRLLGEHFTLVQVPAPHPLSLLADAGMLEQVVMNLVVNARDAMPNGGRIVVRLDEIELDAEAAQRRPRVRAGRFGRLVVIDTGCGMSAATQARIFEPFFTTKEAGKGTGLGLSTVFGIVQQHEGWVEVESVEDRGSSFAVHLPLHLGPHEVRASEAPRAATASGRETIVIAEDDEGVRLGAARVLRQQGYLVHEAADGRQALELLRTHAGKVDLLLSDVVMPGGLLGHDLARHLPAAPRQPRVILMSGYNTHVDPAALEVSGVGYLSKPFDTSTLLRIVRATLDRVEPGGDVGA